MDKPNPRSAGVAVYITRNELYDGSISYGAIPRLIQHIDARNGIIALAKACWILSELGPLNEKAQLLLARQFFRPHHFKIAERLISIQGQTIFFLPQIHILMKYLALYGYQGDEPRVVGPHELKTLGLGLIAVVDLMTADLKPRRKDRKEAQEGDDTIRALTIEIVTSSYLIKKHDLRYDLPRARYMYVDLVRRFASNPPKDFVDIEEIFHEATNIQLDEYISIGIAIMTHYLTRTSEKKDLPTDLDFVLLRLAIQFSKSILSDKLIRSFLDTVSMTMAEFQNRVRDQSKRELAYDFLMLKSAPLLSITDDAYIVLSLPFLHDRLTSGIYWIIFDHLRDNHEGKLHLKWSRFNGIVFQKYVEELVERIYFVTSKQNERILFDQTYHIRGQEFRTPDVMIIGEDYAVLIEASATRLQAKQTTSLGVPEAFANDCEKMIFDNARSLDTFLKNVRSGFVELDDIDTHNIKRFYPVVVTIEGFPNAPPINLEIQRGLRDRGLLREGDIAPLSILDIGDLEFLQVFRNVGMVEALTEWHKNARYPHLTLSQHLKETGQGGIKQDDWFEDLINHIFDESARLVFGRGILD